MNNQNVIDVDVDVVVVGGGVSGLTAARDLRTAGLTVLVLEADDSVGGRTHTLDVGGTGVDAGAQWLGPSQAAVLGLCAELGVETFPSASGADITVSGQGRRRLDRRGTGGLSIRAQLDYLQISFRLDRLARQLDLAKLWEHPRAAEWDAMTMGDWLDGRVLTREVRQAMRIVTLTSFGSEPEELSLLGVLHHINTAGGPKALSEGALSLRVKGGTAQIAGRLHAGLGGTVLIDTRVLRIRHDDSRVQVGTSKGEFRARRVIIAMDPSAADAISFTPNLPVERERLQAMWRQGVGLKGFAVYDRPWWIEEGLSGTAVALNGQVPFTFDASPADGSKGILGLFLDADGNPDDRRGLVADGLGALFGERARNGFEYYEKDWGEGACENGRSAGGCVPGLPPGILSRYGAALTQPVGVIHWAGAESSSVWDAHIEGAVHAGRRAAAAVIASLAGPP